MNASGVKASGGFTSLCKIQQNAGVTATPSTWVKSPFQSVDFDALNEVDFTTNKRWDAAADGIYRITATGSIKGLPNTDGVGCSLRIYKNGTALLEGGNVARSPAGTVINSFSQEGPTMLDDVLSLSAGDYIELYMYQNHTGSLLIQGPNYCVIQRIG